MDSQPLKKSLKRVGWINSVNATWKAYSVRKNYDRTLASYVNRAPGGTVESLLTRRAGARLRCLRQISRPLRIFYMGTDELQDTSGILQALQALGDTQHFVQSDGKYGQFLKGPRAERQRSNGGRLIEVFEHLHRSNCTPDLLFGQLQAAWVPGAALDEIRERYGTLVVNVSMDDRHQYFGTCESGEWGGTYGLIPHVDLVLTAAPECVDWFLKEGCPAVFFPEASDDSIFHPMPDLPKVHDVSFIGARYGVRERIVRALREAGIKVTAFGSGWEGGRLPNEDVPRLFAQSKIILGIGTIGHSEDFYTLKLRDFDATMSGSCYLTHANPDLDLLFEVGREVLTYSSCGDCVAKARYYLTHDEEREAVAVAGRRRAERDHRWIQRFSGVIDLLRSAEVHSGSREQLAVRLT